MSGHPGQPVPPGWYGPPPQGFPPYGPGAAPPPRRRNGRPLLVAAVILLVVAAVGVAVVMRGGSGGTTPVAAPGSGSTATTEPGSSQSAGSSPSAAPSAAPSSSALSPADYQRRLSAFDAAMLRALHPLAAARTPGKVASALTSFRTALVRQTEALRTLEAPDAAGPAHGELVDALDTFAGDLSDAVSASHDWNVCAGSSASALISRGTGAAQLHAAAAKLATADRPHRYRVGTFLPRRTADSKRRLGTGTMIKSPGGGAGHLTITNGGKVDAVITLSPFGIPRALLTVYVRSKASFTVTRIPDGSYTGYVTTGNDWGPSNRGFTRGCYFFKFDDRFDFHTTSSQYTIWKIGLTPQVGGNAHTSSVDPDRFPG